jgi:lipoyl(octanoyl) transferase
MSSGDGAGINGWKKSKWETDMEKQQVIFEDLGRIAYKDAWDYQERLMQKNLAAKLSSNSPGSSGGQDMQPLNTEHHFLLSEHPPVYTLGRNGNAGNVLISAQQMEDQQIEFYKINRGGDITFHGPGQLVGYPILDLEKFYTDIGRYVHDLEEVIILTISEYGIKGGRSKGETGVWIDADIPERARKICAIGIRCSRWITMHGFALNVNTDLAYFNHIIPCGITGKQVTSIEKELGLSMEINEVKTKLCTHFESVFNCRLFSSQMPLQGKYDGEYTTSY